MGADEHDIRQWVLQKLEVASDCPNILVRDPLGLLPEADGFLGRFAQERGYQPVVGATNLTFRHVYEQVMGDPKTKKVMVIDRAPARRRSQAPEAKAPPPFYPDFLAQTPTEARIELDLRQFLIDTTGDSQWPAETNMPRYARLIMGHLPYVYRAHRNLRAAHPDRFTDHDFKTIVAFAALGVPEAAFKVLGPEDYWKIGLLGHDAMQELSSLSPEVTRPIKEQLRNAPAPFCWFVDHDPETVIRAFYLAVISAQHTEHWRLLLSHVDPTLAPFSGIDPGILEVAVGKLIALNPEQAQRDLDAVERSLRRKALGLLLLEQLKMDQPAECAGIIEREGYSTLIRCLALLLALSDLLSPKPHQEVHQRIGKVLFPEGPSESGKFVDSRPSATWSQLREAYRLASELQPLRRELSRTLKELQVLPGDKSTFARFREAWNENQINRLEYFVSALERLVHSAELLPRAEDKLPPMFSGTLKDISQKVRSIGTEIQQQLDRLNTHFQSLVFKRYTVWTNTDSEVCLTSQFLKRCLKPYWDPKHEQAVLLIFDGMRYDIWAELLRPMLLDRMELLADLPASSLLPSETHFTRKAISAGGYPNQFDMRRGEDQLLKEALQREFRYKGDVEVVPPEGLGTGETVHYRADKLDVYIFELCDRELHKIEMKTLPDGRNVPARPLSFIYEQHIKNIINTEVMAIVRGLAPGTKVFVTADHGFVMVPREKLWLVKDWLNESRDCSYLYALLRCSLRNCRAPQKVRDNVWEFSVSDLRMPSEDASSRQTYESVIFPKVGFALSRPESPFNPPAYTHGGISIQELMIPMIALQVKSRDEGLLTLDEIDGPTEVLEGEEIELRMRIRPAKAPVGEADSKIEEIRVEVEANYSREPDRFPLPSQILYVPPKGSEAVYRFIPASEDATDEERRAGMMERVLTLTASCRAGGRLTRKSQTHRFTVRLNTDEIVRRVGNLGNILGLMPKGTK